MIVTVLAHEGAGLVPVSVAAEMQNAFGKNVAPKEIPGEKSSQWPKSSSNRNCAFQ